MASIVHHQKSKIWLGLLTYKIIIYTLLRSTKQGNLGPNSILRFESNARQLIESYDVSDDCVYLEKRTSEIAKSPFSLHCIFINTTNLTNLNVLLCL